MLTRNMDEMLAVADLSKTLNDDDALELFKKALPAVSLLQTEVTSEEVKKQVLEALKDTHENLQIDLISLALKGKKVSFDKVIGMIDKLAVLLQEEQGTDDQKKEYCEVSLDKAEDDLKTTDTAVSEFEKATSDANEKLAALTDERAVLTKGFADLALMVKEASYNRKEEHEDDIASMQQDAAAQETIKFAKKVVTEMLQPVHVQGITKA